MLLFPALLSCIAAFQQTPITGKVTSGDDQQPLQGVSVTVKGTNTGTATNEAGTFTINADPSSATLIFSFVGYQENEVELKGRSSVDIVLQRDVNTLAETVITANAIRRDKRSLGYSAPVIKDDELRAGRRESAISALQGKVAGVNVTSTSGAPGSSNRIVLRGGSSILGNNQALMVVDGVPVDNSDFVAGSDIRSTQASGNVDPRSTVGFGNRGNDINPEDIESITVLKGPAAAALYGSRASNGALIITTKSGRRGANRKNEVALNSTLTFSNVLKLPTLQNQYGQGYFIGNDDQGVPQYFIDPKENWSWGPAFDGEEKEWGQSINGVRLKKPFVAQPDNLRKFFDLGRALENNLSFQGSGEKTTFYMSLNSLNSNGLWPGDNDNFNRYSIRFNGTANLTNKISSSININYINIRNDQVQTGQGPGSAFDNLLQTPRDIPIDKMSDLGNPYYGYGLTNAQNQPAYGFYGAYTISPYYILENFNNRNNVDRVTGNITLTYKPLDWLDIVERLGGDVYSDRRMFKYPRFTYVPIDDVTGNYSVDANTNSQVGEYSENTFNVNEIVHDLMVTARKELGADFSGSLMVGHNIRQRRATILEASTNKSAGLVVPGWYNLDNSNGPVYTYNEYSNRRLVGLYSQLALDYRDMLFLEMTARNDWSSTLPEANRSFFYPSISTSFVFTELLKGGLADFFNYGKVRASWAQVGNDANPYLLNTYFSRNPIESSFGSTTFPFNGVPGLTQGSRIGNPDLKPEITTAYEAGAELSFLNNRVYIDFSYYRNRSKNQILTIPIAESSGFTNKVINGGIVENKGVELSVRGIPVRLDNGFTVELYGTFTKNKNEVVDLQLEGVKQVSLGGLADLSVVAAEGMPYGTFYGIDVQKDELGRVIVDPVTGIPLETPNAVYLGSYNPDFIASLGTRIRFKAFSLNLLFDTKQGGYFVSRTKDIIAFNGTSWETAEFGRDPYVFPNSVYYDQSGKLVENTSVTFLPQDYFPALPYGRNVIDASYVKLREASISYKIPKRILDRTPFGELTVGIFGNNLALWTPSENKYADPEINSAGATNLQGFDFTAQPSQRNFGVNVNVTF
ncbi:MAG: SusC/RagA family TonB-linked outer membrane protein [Chitinophagaceae bacterium]|nr:SusC/RagA family TonB-linked outer membrane protein [Chitinophagaceae bacterium]